MACKKVESLKEISIGLNYVYQGLICLNYDIDTQSVYCGIGNSYYKVSIGGIDLKREYEHCIYNANVKRILGNAIGFKIQEGVNKELVEYFIITERGTNIPALIYKATESKKEMVLRPKVVNDTATGIIGEINAISYRVAMGKSFMLNKKMPTTNFSLALERLATKVEKDKIIPVDHLVLKETQPELFNKFINDKNAYMTMCKEQLLDRINHAKNNYSNAQLYYSDIYNELKTLFKNTREYFNNLYMEM